MQFVRLIALAALLAVTVACPIDPSDPPPVPAPNVDALPSPDAIDTAPSLPLEPVDASDADLPEPDLVPDSDVEPPACLPGEETMQIFDCRGGESVEVNCPCIAGAFVCDFDPTVDCRPIHCDDGFPLECAEEVPLCRPGEIPARRDGCWACVDEVTCEVFTPCDLDRDCPDYRRCDPCASSSCPGCDDCVGACVESPCPSESAIGCGLTRPECADDEVGVIRDGCWVCVNEETCEPYEGACRDHGDCAAGHQCEPCGMSSCPDCDDCVPDCVDLECDTETALVCEEHRPDCSEGLVAVIENGCWECISVGDCGVVPSCEREGGFCTVGPAACPEGSTRLPGPECRTLGDCCLPDDPLACTRLGGACFPTAIPCPEGFDGDESVLCLPDGLCCTPADPPERRCDDGSTLICTSDPPEECDELSELALVAGCWECVNSLTCLPWGEPGCIDERDCSVTEFCDFCGTSSCPFCGDCVPACAPLE